MRLAGGEAGEGDAPAHVLGELDLEARDRDLFVDPHFLEGEDGAVPLGGAVGDLAGEPGLPVDPDLNLVEPRAQLLDPRLEDQEVGVLELVLLGGCQDDVVVVAQRLDVLADVQVAPDLLGPAPDVDLLGAVVLRVIRQQDLVVQ